jgi:hypothetical protein
MAADVAGSGLDEEGRLRSPLGARNRVLPTVARATFFPAALVVASPEGLTLCLLHLE